MGIRKTTEQFIKEVKERNHHDLDLSLVKYKGCDEEVTVICPIHGEFNIQASYLRQGSGCRKCADEHRNDNRRMSIEEFQNIVFQKYGNKLDTSLAKFRTLRDKIIMKCIHHNEFETTPSRIINGDGCPKCNLEELKRKNNEKKDGFYSEKKLKKLWHTNNPKVIAEEFGIKSTIINAIGGNGTFYPKDECNKVIEYLNDYVKNFDGNEESARKQFMINIRRKKMSLESRGLISCVELARQFNTSRHAIYRSIDYLQIPNHREIDPIGHVDVKVISLEDVDKLKEFFKNPNKSKILSEDSLIQNYGSLEKANEIRVNKILETRENWSDEKKKEVSDKLKQIHAEINADPIRKQARIDKIHEGLIKNFGSWENYVKYLNESVKNTLIKKHGSLEEAYKANRLKFYNHLEEQGITVEEYNAKLYQRVLESLSEIYGKKITNLNQLPNWREKLRETWDNKTVEELNEIDERKRKTMMERYGVENPNDLNTYQKLYYKGLRFDSSWELFVYLYLVDNNIPFEFHKKNFYIPYEVEGRKCRYYPDFIINGKIYEVKGEQYFDENDIMINPYDETDKRPKYKQKCMAENNVTIIRKKDIKKYEDNFKKNHKDIILADLYGKKENKSIFDL